MIRAGTGKGVGAGLEAEGLGAAPPQAAARKASRKGAGAPRRRIYLRSLARGSAAARIAAATRSAIKAAPFGEKCVLSEMPFG